MNEKRFRQAMAGHIELFYGDKPSPVAAVAEALGVSRQYIGQVLNGRKPPSKAILNMMGMVKRVGAVTYHRELK